MSLPYSAETTLFFSEMDKNTQIYSECHTDEDHIKIFGKIRTMDCNMGQHP